MQYKLNNLPINIYDQITIGKTDYPCGSLLLRKDEWCALGITEEPDNVVVLTQIELETNKANNINKLWQAAYDYEFNRISGVAIGLLTIGVITQNSTALAIATWSGNHWNNYYTKKALVTSTRDMTLEDFTSSGEIPFTIPQLRSALGM